MRFGLCSSTIALTPSMPGHSYLISVLYSFSTSSVLTGRVGNVINMMRASYLLAQPAAELLCSFGRGVDSHQPEGAGHLRIFCGCHFVRCRSV